MQITFNTEDSLEDLQNVHQLLLLAIKKKSSGANLGQPEAQTVAVSATSQAQSHGVNTEVFMQNPVPPTVSRLASSPFASLLKAEQSTSLGSPIHSVNKQVPVQQNSNRNSEVSRINEAYRRQYEESKTNPKPKGQNPELDMTNIYMSDAGRKEGRSFRKGY